MGLPTRRFARFWQPYIEANVPGQPDFDKYLARDLSDYFKSAGKEIELSHELLRDGPTQSGVAYPKYFLWVKVKAGNEVVKQGALRVAAIDKKLFVVYEFLSKSLIQKNPSSATQAFPGMLLARI